MESGQYQRSTGRLPDWYLKQPPSCRGDGVYLAGFHILNTERDHSKDCYGPIPWTKAWDYAYRIGLDRSMCVQFANVMVMLDGHDRKHRAEERERQEKQDKKKAARDKRKAEAESHGVGRRRKARQG